MLVFSTSVAVAQYYDTKTLIGLFETALHNDSDALWMLQETFFNPDSKQSPEKVCLSVSISVQDITHPERGLEYCDYPWDAYDTEKWQAAFVYEDDSGTWFFNSYYELHQQVNNDTSDTQELANLITSSGSTGVFYSFDPSFYSIMQTLSSSIALMFPYDDHSYYSSDYVHINIPINRKFDGMICWAEAVHALRSVLMWVSFNLQHHDMQVVNLHSCMYSAG